MIQKCEQMVKILQICEQNSFLDLIQSLIHPFKTTGTPSLLLGVVLPYDKRINAHIHTRLSGFKSDVFVVKCSPQFLLLFLNADTVPNDYNLVKQLIGKGLNKGTSSLNGKSQTNRERQKECIGKGFSSSP